MLYAARAVGLVLHGVCGTLQHAATVTPTAQRIMLRVAIGDAYCRIKPAWCHCAKARTAIALRLLVCRCGAGRPRPPAAADDGADSYSDDARLRRCAQQTNKPPASTPSTLPRARSDGMCSSVCLLVCFGRNRLGVRGTLEYSTTRTHERQTARAHAYACSGAHARADSCMRACVRESACACACMSARVGARGVRTIACACLSVRVRARATARLCLCAGGRVFALSRSLACVGVRFVCGPPGVPLSGSCGCAHWVCVCLLPLWVCLPSACAFC
jgi:hypothetical protein